MFIRLPVLTTCGTLLIPLLVFTACVAAQTPSPALKALYEFRGEPHGGNPTAGVVIGSGGALYGTTPAEGYRNSGTVSSLTPPTSPGGNWTEALICEFNGGYGVAPNGLAVGARGVLYGTAISGSCGWGFALIPPKSPGTPWTFKVLHDLSGTNGPIGCQPTGTLAIDGAGVLYGTANYCPCYGGLDVVFALTPPKSAGSPWTEEVLYSFTDASTPNAGVVIGSGGVLYGTATGGGTSGNGTGFSLAPPTSQGGAWTEAVLYNFTGGSDGGGPFAGVVIGRGGVLYGTTTGGGNSGGGTVFSLTPPASTGGSWTEAVLYNFTGGSDGSQPYAGVVVGRGGVLYGTTTGGGNSGGGTVEHS